MEIELFETKGLGDNSFLVISGKEAAIVDPQRDIDRFTKILDERDLKLRYILESHVHNDYISGALELKDRYTNVELALPKLGDYEFEHKGMKEGAQLKLGNIELSVLDTPGHTYEHISWIAKEDGRDVGAFTGGSLIVGSAGRTDLLGHDHTHKLTELQYESMQKYRDFSKDMKIYPTHGQGSFCTSANSGTSRISTLGQEIDLNQAMRIKDKNLFIKALLSGLMKYPDYYPYMAPINRKGPKVYGQVPEPNSLDIAEFSKIAENAYIIDTRQGNDFAKMHNYDLIAQLIAKSYNFQMASSTFSYIGWVLPFNSPIIIVSGENYAEDAKELTKQLFRIGFEQILGYLEGGIQTWIEAGRQIGSYHAVDATALDTVEITKEVMLDVRDPQEIHDFEIEGTRNMFIGEFNPLQLDHHPYYVYCVSGQRAATAASLLNMAGYDVNLIYNGGVEEVKRNISKV